MLTRRGTLRTIGLALGAGTLALGSRTGRATSGWIERQSPTTNQLNDVSYALDGAYAVGDGGYVLERDGGDWVVIEDDGVSGNGENLYGSDATDDGERLWVVGNSGAIGEYDVLSNSLLNVLSPSDDEDYSAPNDYTGNFRDVVATGDGGDANVFITDDSGYVHYSFDNGQNWEYTTPGSGSTIPAIDFYDEYKGHCSDTNQSVFHTEDGENWAKIGVDNRDENFYGLDSNDETNVWVAGNEGVVLEYDGSWSATTLGGGNVTLRDIEVTTDRTSGLTVGSNGRVFRKSGDWVEAETPTGDNLKAVVRGDPDAFNFNPTVSDMPDIAVGASGTIIEHQ